MTNKISKYGTGFSTGALLFKEAEAIINEIHDPAQFMTGQENINYQIVPVNSESSKKRLGVEITKRLRNTKNEVFISQYLMGSTIDKNLILFYSACKTYQIISDFMLDIVLNKWYNLDFELGAYDFQSFIYKLMGKHEELEKLSQSTIKKLSHVVMKMLSQLGILNDGKLQKLDFNPKILRNIAQNGDLWFLEVLFLTITERNEIIE